MGFGDQFKKAMDRLSGKPNATESELTSDEKSYATKSAMVATVIDGKEVNNLSLWMDEIANCCKAGRDIHYGPEGFVGYIEDCQRFYVGDHWEDTSDASLRLIDSADLKVENRIAEKIEIIAPMMVRQRPTIGVLPRTGGDVEKAAVVADILDEKLRAAQFEKVLTQAMIEAPKFGTGIVEVQQFLHRNEPSGFARFKVCDPLSVAWEPGAPSIEEARVVVHVELMDTEEAEAHFTFLLGKPVENLPCEGDTWNELTDWSLVHRSNNWADKSAYSGQRKFLNRTRITWIWYMDSERKEEEIMQPAEVIRKDEFGNAVPKMLDERTQDIDLATGEPLWETDTVEQPLLVNELDEFGQPLLDELGQPIMKVAKRNVPVYRNGRLFVKAGEDRIIYDGENPYLHGDSHPFTSFTYLPINGSPFGKPLVQNVHTDQQRINTAVTQISKHASLCGNPALEVDMSLLDAAEMADGFTNAPGKIWKKKAGANGKAIQPVEYQAVNSSVIQNYQLASASFERISGASNVSSGDSATSESGIKVQTLDQITERKLEPFAISRDAGIERIGRQFLSNINQFVSKEEIVRIVIDNKPNPLDPMAAMQQQVEFGALMDYLDDPLSLKYDVIVVPQQGTMTTRQQRFIQSREQASQGLLHPSIPLQYSDVPGAKMPMQQNGVTPFAQNKQLPVTGKGK